MHMDAQLSIQWSATSRSGSRPATTNNAKIRAVVKMGRIRDLARRGAARGHEASESRSRPVRLCRRYDPQVKRASISSPLTPTGHGPLRLGAVGVLSLAMVVTWTLMMNRAAEALSFEPNSDDAIAHAAAARPAGVSWAVLEVAAVVALAVVARRVWVGWLAAPGLVVASHLLLDPSSNGGALILGLAASVLGVAGAAGAVVRRAYARERQLRGPSRTSEPKPAWPGLPG